MKRQIFCALLGVLSAAAAVAQTPAPVAVTFETNAVVASGITPGADAAFFAVLQVPEEFSVASMRRDEMVADSDGDGVVRLEMPDGVATRSIWAVVDVRTGNYALAVPHGYRLRLAEDTDDHGMRRDNKGHVSHIERVMGYAEMLVVRPGEGAWLGSAGQGAPSDADFTDDGKLTLDFDELVPQGKAGPSPGQLQPGDTVVLIEPVEMQAFAVRVNEKK
jgi:hypothetical protein